MSWDQDDYATLTLEVAEADTDTVATVTAWTRPDGTSAVPPSAAPSADRKLWEAVAPVPMAGEWTATWLVTGHGAGGESYQVQVAPRPPVAARSYATTAHLADWLQAAPPAGSARKLAAATRVVDLHTISAVYDVTGTDELPTDPAVALAFREAVCAQVEAWQANGTGPTGPGAAQWQTMTAGRVSLGRGAGTPPGVHGDQLAPEARAILQAAGLLGRPWQA